MNVKSGYIRFRQNIENNIIGMLGLGGKILIPPKVLKKTASGMFEEYRKLPNSARKIVQYRKPQCPPQYVQHSSKLNRQVK